MSNHWSNRLKIQKMDRRMSGHAYFKYRIEFPWAAFNFLGASESYYERIKTFYDFCKHLTDIYGYGPSVDDASSYFRAFGAPKWAFRLNEPTHICAVYVADEDGRQELEKIIAFNILKH